MGLQLDAVARLGLSVKNGLELRNDFSDVMRPGRVEKLETLTAPTTLPLVQEVSRLGQAFDQTCCHLHNVLNANLFAVVTCAAGSLQPASSKLELLTQAVRSLHSNQQTQPCAEYGAVGTVCQSVTALLLAM